MGGKQQMTKVHLYFQYASIGGLIFIFVFPILWSLVTSFKTIRDAMAIPPVLLFKPTLNNYIVLFTKSQFLDYLLNSIIISASTTIISTFIGTLAAYSLARLPFKGINIVALGILIVRMIPMVSLAVPIYIWAYNLGLLDTHLVLILTYTTFNLPFVVWIMWGYIKQLPAELEDAAQVDGCTRLGALFKIVLPMAAPGAAAASIFCAIFSWNEFLYALVLTSTNARTMPVAAASFITLVGVQWDMVFAAVIVIAAPIVIFTLALQRYFVSGLTMGAVKG